MKKKDCKYLQQGATFIPTEESMDNGKTRIGYWSKGDRICVRFESEDEQYERIEGFFFCGCPEKCDFYEIKKEAKI